jgi:integrase
VKDHKRSPLGSAPGLETYIKADGSKSYRLRYRVAGVQRAVPIAARSDTEATAIAWLLIARAEHDESDERTVLDLLPTFVERARLADSTKGLYRHQIETFAGELASKPMSEVAVHDVRAWLHALDDCRHNGRPYSQNSKHGIRSAMASIWKFPARHGVVHDNPFSRLDRGDAIVRPDDEAPRTITVAQADAIADELGAELRALVRLAIRTGLRSAELRALRWEDIDLARRTYRLTQQVSLSGTVVHRLKTSRSCRETRLLTPARDELVRWRAESRRSAGLVFRNADGGPVDRSVLRRRLIAACESVGLEPVSMHVFRHSFVAILRDAGASIDDAAAYARDLPTTRSSRCVLPARIVADWIAR